MNKLHNKDFSIAFKTGTDANKSKFKKECVQGEIYHATDTGFFYVAEVTAGASDATLSKFGATAPPAWNNNTYSVEFDASDDYLSITQDSAINISGDITLSAWVKSNTTTSYNSIFTKRQVLGSINYQLTINNSNGQLGLGHSGGFIYNTTTAISTSTWYHVAVTVSGSTAQFYVNGVAEDSFTGVSITSTTHDLIIGATVGYNYFGGNVDEASIFNSALSSTDITSIYNSGVPNDISSLNPVGWWRMGDNNSGSGTTITDQGSGGNDATLNNGPTFSTDVPTFNTYSVEFDASDDYMSISDADIFSLGNGSGTDNAFSISGWFNADNIHTNYIATKDASGNREWAFRTVVNQLHFFAFGTGGGYIGRKYTTNLSGGQWYHAVVTYDGSKASSGIKLYVDGTRVDDADYASGTYTASVNTTAEVRVSSLQVNNTYTGGKVDELSFFNTELSASDVTAMYNSGVPTDISSLSPVAWYRMGENNSGTGTTITDQGSGGNDGTLNNGPTFSTDIPS